MERKAMHEIGRKDVNDLPNDSTKVLYAYNQNQKINSQIKKNKAKQKRILIMGTLLALLWIATVLLLLFHQWLPALISGIGMMLIAAPRGKLYDVEGAVLAIFVFLLLFAPIMLIIDIIRYVRFNRKNQKLTDQKYYMD